MFSQDRVALFDGGLGLIVCRLLRFIAGTLQHLKIKVVFLGKVAPLLKKADRKYLETNIVELRAFVCLCMLVCVCMCACLGVCACEVGGSLAALPTDWVSLRLDWVTLLPGHF